MRLISPMVADGFIFASRALRRQASSAFFVCSLLIKNRGAQNNDIVALSLLDPCSGM
jgi:hypothetical protein